MKLINPKDVQEETFDNPFPYPDNSAPIMFVGYSPILVPVVCTVSAGKSIEYLPILSHRKIRPVSGARTNDRFCAAHVNGSSLIGDRIYDGDYAIIRLTFDDFEVTPGRLVAALTPQGMVIKHVYSAPGHRVRLVSSNPSYPDVIYEAEQVNIQGLVVRIERDY